jgi:anti-sigma-K factor RskA
MVESYVLGLATEQERAEFEQLCTQYPELVEARTNFELLLEKQVMQNAETTPVDSKNKIWSALQQVPSSNTSKIITMEPRTTRTRNASGMTWLAAASVILMLVAAYFAYDFRKKNDELKSSNEQMQAKINRIDSMMDAKAEEERIMHDPNVIVVNMKAMTPAAPSASVYWDTTSSKVYLVVKNMPKLASDKQYQLWSLIDSAGKMKPSSLGLFDGGDEKLFFKMENAQNADHFAITIENRGNTEGPDTKQMQIMGETKRKL